MTNPRTLSLEKLKAEHTHGTTAPKRNPPKLSLAELTTERGVFQMREEEADSWVTDLHKVLKQGDLLTPLLVWWTGKRWVVMDGHHRLEAYRRDAEGKAKYRLIPVEVSQAENPEAAIIEANRENRKNKLNTTEEDKHRQAWFFTVEGIGGSVRAVAEATGSSKSTVQRMRDARAKLTAKGWSKDRLMGLKWQQVIELTKDRPGDWTGTISADEELERAGRAWAERLQREFGGKLLEAPDIAALMLLTYSREATKRVLQSRFLWELREEIEAEERREAKDDPLEADDTADLDAPF